MARKDGSAPPLEFSDPPAPPAVPVIGIGASAGGVKALQALFAAIPEPLGAAFVVIVHLDPRARSELAEILASRTSMPVHRVTGRSALMKDCVYVIAPDRQLGISETEIWAEPFAEPRGRRAPIDHFFCSLARQHGDGFAVILTGAGSDGTIGVKAVKEAGGIILVQDPDEAEYPSMPRSAIATEAADFILPLAGLAAQLKELMGAKARAALPPAGADRDGALRRILAHLQVRTGHDFQHYKRSTVTRRVLRRLQVTRKESLEEYAAFLRQNAEEAAALLADLLISVTTFFRDSRAFEALAEKVIPRLFDEARPNEPIRVWIVGCATGEEAYSIGMLLLEEAQRRDVRPEIQVFGSDMDARALAMAREGRYPAAIEADVGPERLSRFFTREDLDYRVRRELRDIVLFANHSVLKDPPFSRLDLISCRNLLIYLDRELQHQVLATLRYALKGQGYLLLGASETADHRERLFRAVDREARLYRAAGRGRGAIPVLSRLVGVDEAAASAPAAPAHVRGVQTAHRLALEASAPPSILIDEQHRVLHLSETAGRYLQPSGGPMSADILELVRQDLRSSLATALAGAFESEETILSPAVAVRFNGAAHPVSLQVRPVRREHDQERRQALVLFLEGGAVEPSAPEEAAPQDDAGLRTVGRLTHELAKAQTHLRAMREDSEAANEELRAANEELQSINEEYRSTSEELETSKEELQSINEELQTVNSELKLKLETVSRAHSDLQNLMAATDFGTLFLDLGLRIKRFSPRLADLFSITPGDVGRPITDFAHQLDYDELAGDARQVLDTLLPVEREIRSRPGRWYLVRVRPYRTLEDRIDGVVTTFTDVTERRRMVDALRGSEDRLRQEMRLVEASRSPIFVWDFDHEIRQWNRGSEELYGYSAAEAIGRKRDELLETRLTEGSFETIKAALLEKGFWHGELHETAKDGRAVIVDAHVELVTVGERRYVLESTRDITEARTWDQRQRLLLNELTHRVRNVLTVVQGVVSQTWRTGDRENFIERVGGRIGALAGAHKLLVESDWRGADLRSLVESQLAPYPSEASGRLHLHGPSVSLPADLATPLGLVVHELATNAAKHGAFSNDTGEVDLRWKMSDGGEPPVLTVEWREAGGPPIAAPAKLGVGSRLIRQGLPGAKVSHDLAPQGARCTLTIALPPSALEGAHG